MKKLAVALVVVYALFPIQMMASHIVGGEFEMTHLSKYQFRLNLTQYFDVVNGYSEAEDDYADAYIFSKDGEVLIEKVRLQKVHTELVDYSNPTCSKGNLVTKKIVYSDTLTLSPAKYNSTDGYFVVYERCCRNAIIVNLVEPTHTGQTFYMEFPAVTSHINSSPSLNPPVNDYACVGQPFQYDFSSQDLDGDSLVYSLVAPFNSSSSAVALPEPSGAPGSTVSFVNGIDHTNMIPGEPALKIDAHGLISVTPTEVGVYVFGTRVEEFRRGKKIGEVRRDYQLSVLDCYASNAPVLSAYIKGEIAPYQEEAVVRFENSDERCLLIQASDLDMDESLTFELLPVNFDADLSHLLPQQIYFTNKGDTVSFELCFPECPFLEGEMLIDLIVRDNSCSQPLSNSVRFTIDYEGPPNQEPFIRDNPAILSQQVSQGSSFELPLEGVDPDRQWMTMTAEGVGFNVEDAGMRLVDQANTAGAINKVFLWEADCEKYQLSGQTDFEVVILLTDETICGNNLSDSLKLRLHLTTPLNNRPKVSLQGEDETDIAVTIGQEVNLTVIATDFDNDYLRLEARGEGFTLSDYQMAFSGNRGTREISAPFSWNPSCEVFDLQEKDQFTVWFFATEERQCGSSKTDSIAVTFHLNPPVNHAPRIYIHDYPEDTISALIGNEVRFAVAGQDEDNDWVTLSLASVFLNGHEMSKEVSVVEFNQLSGYKEVVSSFSWKPDCASLSSDTQDTWLEVSFVASDNKCQNAKSDTIRKVIAVYDAPLSFSQYTPANAFTPNDDGFGDYFYLQSLPEGNCSNRFEKVVIFNRWGTPVFTSNEPEFRWYARGVPGGVYFYEIRYTYQVYKNEVFVHR